MNEGLKKKISLTAMAVSAGMVLGMTSSLAADLGGNCCADLEERVAELEATTVKKGTRKTSVELYGLVNAAIVAWDDGSRSNAAIGYGNHNQQTRFGIRGNAKIGGEYSAGYSLVLDVADKSRTSTFSQTQDIGGSKLGQRNDDYAMRLRDANWWMESSRLGRVTVGRITNEVATGSPDLGGIQHAASDDIGCNGGGLRFRNSTTNGLSPTSLGGYSAGGCAGPWANRLQGIKWQSPTLAGFQFLASYGPNLKREVAHIDSTVGNVSNFGVEWGIGARYAGEFNGVRVAANAGYTVDDLNKETNMYTDVAPFLSGRTKLANIGLGLKHVPTGLFTQGEYSRLSVEQETLVGTVIGLSSSRDATRWHIAAGIGRNWFGIGDTTLYGEYMRSENFFFAYQNVNTTTGLTLGNVSGDKVSTWGLGFNQAIDAAAMDLYINYRNHKLSDPNFATFAVPFAAAQSFKDISVLTTGARIKF